MGQDQGEDASRKTSRQGKVPRQRKSVGAHVARGSADDPPAPCAGQVKIQLSARRGVGEEEEPVTAFWDDMKFGVPG